MTKGNVNNHEAKMFEFLLTIDNNIIVQRIFSVRGYNPNVKKSLDLYNTVTYICEKIEEDMKKKTFEFMTDNQDFFMNEDYEDNPNSYKKVDYLLEIKSENEVFIQRVFPSYVYHPKVRVDIRHMLKDFLFELTDTLSSNTLEDTYLGKSLEVNYLGKE